MKKKVLLVDESLTVQKVVALTLDKNRYQLSFAKNKADVIKQVVESSPDLILFSDQVPDCNYSSFPKELESWIGGVREVPPVILITAQDIREQKHYAAVLRKPFSPQALQTAVGEYARDREAPMMGGQMGNLSPATGNVGNRSMRDDDDDIEDERLQKIFNETFADESSLVKETYRAEDERTQQRVMPRESAPAQRPQADWDANNLWNEPAPQPQMGAQPRGGQSRMENNDNLWGAEAPPRPNPRGPAVTDEAVERQLKAQDLDAVVDRVLGRMVTPIIERLVQERLDKLMKEQEQFLELKP